MRQHSIRNLDESLYRQARARAALEARPVGELINSAVALYLALAEGKLRVEKPAAPLDDTRELAADYEAVAESWDQPEWGSLGKTVARVCRATAKRLREE